MRGRPQNRRHVGAAAAALGVAYCLCPPAFAGEAKADRAPTSTGVELFGDWKRVCEIPPGSKSRVCFIFQKVNFAETDTMLLQAVAGYFRADVPDPVLILTAPLGTFLPPGIEVRLKDGSALASHFEVCMAVGCQASLKLDPDRLRRLGDGASVEVVVRDGAKKQVSIPLSLKGLTAGLDSLKAPGQ